MSSTRTVKSIRNMKWGLILQICNIITKFVTRTAFVKILGSDYNGVNGLFTEVLAMMSLAELGVGTAIVYNLYKPLAEDDREAVKRLMGLFKVAYRIIGFAMLGIGLVCMPFIHLIVRKVPFENSYIRQVFMLFVVQMASSYFFAYKRSLLNADQNNYIVSIFTMAFNVLLMLLSVAILVATHSFVMYLLVQIAVTVASNVAISVYADRKYPYLKKTSMVTDEEKRDVFSNIKNIFIGSLSYKITASTDNILISVLVGTHLLGIYSNYSLITTAFVKVFDTLSASISGGIGNLMVTESGEHIDKVFKRTSFMFYAAGLMVSVVSYSVMTPFVRLWLGNDFVIGNAVLFVCMLNVFFMIAREPLWAFIKVSGLFAADKYISIAGSSVNLVVSVILGRYFGMTGIFLGTVCTHVIQIVLKSVLLYRKKLNMGAHSCIFGWSKITLLSCVLMLLSGTLCSRLAFLSPVTELAAGVLLSGLISAAALLVLYGRTEEFSYAVGMLKKSIIKRR